MLPRIKEKGIGLENSNSSARRAGPDLFIDGEDVDASNWARFINHASQESSS